MWVTLEFEYCFQFAFTSLQSMSSLVLIAHLHFMVIDVYIYIYDLLPIMQLHLKVWSKYADSDSRICCRCCEGTCQV